MKLPAPLQKHLQWINLPGGLLIALLQRTPVVPVAATAEEFAVASPIGAILKSAAAAMASLGAMHSLAGATQLSVSPAGNPGTATVGTSKTVLFTVIGAAAAPGSWTFGGTLPPGMHMAAINSGTAVNAGTPINASTIQLTGTPTTAGNFDLSLTAWLSPGASGDNILFFYTLAVTGGATTTAPSITTQPLSQTVNTGVNVTFTAAADGSPAPTFQWRKDGTNIAGATNTTLILPSVTAANAGTYSVVATNSAGGATSNGAVLTVNPAGGGPPVIIGQPLSVTINSGTTVAFVVTATSTSTASYQWRKDGAAVVGGTSDTLILSGATAVNAGTYSVIVTNSAGSVTSNAASLAVTSGQISRISNMSVRTNLASGQLLTVGFVTSGAKNLLLRANGPGLNSFFGLGGFYPDPKIAVINSTTGLTVAQNDDWVASQLASVFVSLGAFPWLAGSKDAALEPLVSGPHTAQINGTGPGVLLLEVYDADAAGSAARLTNVSARNQVGAGADVLISGFVIDGGAARTLLIRGIGPGLHDFFGVNSAGLLADPVLEVHQLVGGTVDTFVASNDNWNGNLTAVFPLVGAYPFNAGSKDAAMIITLPPGIYTAQVSGLNSGTGDGVVEVYELP